MRLARFRPWLLLGLLSAIAFVRAVPPPRPFAIARPLSSLLPLSLTCLSLLALLTVWLTQQVWTGASETDAAARVLTGGDPSRAPSLFIRYGCAGCHTIPGIPGADGQVGGALGGMRHRVYIAGVLPNTPDNLIGWIVQPDRYSERTAMPASGISIAEARDVAAWLYEN
jgi:mono/diheme cytochrome c family protein